MARPFRSFAPVRLAVEPLEGRDVPATFVVSSAADAGLGSLRDALAAANGTPGADAIVFQNVTGTIALTSGVLDITDAVTITGPGAAALTIDGGGSDRIFYLDGTTPGAAVTITGLTLSNGSATGDRGGAILNIDANLTLANTAFTGNRADDGGAVAVEGGSLTVTDSTFGANTADGSVGGGGAIFAAPGIVTTIVRSTFTGNTAAAGDGGAVLFGDGSISDSVVSGNTSARVGGGLAFYGSLTVTATQLNGNAALVGGGVGALYGGTLVVRDSTISGNRTGGANSEGGAGIAVYDTDLTVENSTVSGNTAAGDPGVVEGNAAGVLVRGGTAVILNSTIAFNVLESGAGASGILLSGSGTGGGTLDLQNTIVANNTGGPDLARFTAGGSAPSFLVSTLNATNSLFGDAGAVNGTNTGNVLGADPRLGPLRNNGGPTPTHALLPGSPAIDAGDTALSAGLAFDQRGPGFPRVRLGGVDIGAVEFASAAVGGPGTGPLGAGDFTGDGADGRAEVVVGARPGELPVVKVIDAATGDAVRTILAYDPGFTGGVFAATGDVTGDGVADVVTGAGAGGGPHVKVFDGATGNLVRSFFAFGGSFAGGARVAAGDVNNDGFADIAVAAGPGGGPRVSVFDGRTGAEVTSFFAYPANFAGGVWVSAADTDGDGTAEVLTGAGAGGGPNVRIFDGTTGDLLDSFFAFAPDFTGGVTVTAADLDGDGRPELIAGVGEGGGSTVRVFDGATGDVKAEFDAFEPAFRGGVYVGTGDVTGPVSSPSRGRSDSTGDGVPEILTLPFPTGGPRVVVFDPRSFAAVDSFFVTEPVLPDVVPTAGTAVRPRAGNG